MPLLIFFLFLILLSLGAKTSFAQVYPTPTPLPAGYCGDGDCLPEDGEACDICVPDCGTCLQPGEEECDSGVCPDGRVWKLYCTPSCDAVPRTCWHNNSCTWPPDNCNEYGGDDWCASWVSCGPGTVDCTIPVCGPGGNCYADCTFCDGGTPPPDYTPPPPTPPIWCITPTTPVLISPVNGSETGTDVNLDWDPVISWGNNPDDPDGTLRGYKAYLDTSANPSTLRCNVNQWTTNCFVSGLVMGTSYCWKVVADNGCDTKESNIWCFNVQAYTDAWFQTQEGDVHGQTGISSPVIDGEYFCKDADGYPGVVSYEGSADFGEGEVSSQGWLAKTSFSKKSYNYFYSLLGSPTLEIPPPEIKNEDLPSTDQVKAFSGDVQTGNEWQLGTKRIVIITNGKFLIKHRIVIDPGGSLVVIAKEGIGVFKNIGDTDEVQGIFITDGTFSSSTEEDFTPVESNRQLVIDGEVIAGQVDLKRDLETDNSTIPAEQFVFRPDFLLNSYQDLWRSSFTWQELAP